MEIRADDRADLYKKLSGKQRDALVPALAHAHREDIRQLASYEEDTAGAIMTSSYVALSLEQTVTEALTALRREAPRSETIYRAYVIDDNRKLLGSVRLKDIITAPAPASTGKTFNERSFLRFLRCRYVDTERTFTNSIRTTALSGANA